MAQQIYINFSFKLKNKLNIQKLHSSKISYYIRNLLRQVFPRAVYTNRLLSKLVQLKDHNKAYIAKRVNYYNQLSDKSFLGNNTITLGNMKIFKSPKAYNFDTFEYTRYFDKSLRGRFLFGDATHVESYPTIQKSRPVSGDNKNAVLLNLDKQRHFIFLKDPVPYADKKNILIARGVVTQPHRVKFMEMYFGHPCCDLGQVNLRGGNRKWIKPKISVAEHLNYKFILSLEGNDVATNLKWIMSSNSIAVMPKPKYETWFMEGTLVAGKHYIEIRDDYADLVEKLTWYIEHENAALQIIKNANIYVEQFFDRKREDLISLLVLQKYFYCTGQMDSYALA